MLTSHSMDPFNIPAQMIAEIALDIEPSEQIAYRYGYPIDEWQALRATELVDRAIEVKRAELRSSGYTQKMKFNLMATDLMERAYKVARDCDNATLKLEVAKYAAKLADMEPKQNQPALQGTGFSININLSGAKSRHLADHDDLTNTIIVTQPSDSDLPAAPSYLAVLPFESLSPA